MWEENKNSIDKKKAKLKEVEESVMAKLQVKQGEIDEIKAAHAREMAQLYRNMDEMRDKVIYIFPSDPTDVCLVIKPTQRRIQTTACHATNRV